VLLLILGMGSVPIVHVQRLSNGAPSLGSDLSTLIKKVVPNFKSLLSKASGHLAWRFTLGGLFSDMEISLDGFGLNVVEDFVHWTALLETFLLVARPRFSQRE
jgi:hypothetical protein